MRYSCILLLLCLLIGACSTPARTRAVLSVDEEAALAFLKKDPYMRVTAVERSNEGQLIVKTLQGEKHIFYKITASPNATPKDMIQLIPPHLIYKLNF